MKFNNPTTNNTAINTVFVAIESKSAWGKKQLRDLITPVFSEEVVFDVISVLASNTNKTIVMETLLCAYINEQIGKEHAINPIHFNEQFRLLLLAQTPTFSIDTLKLMVKTVYATVRRDANDPMMNKIFKSTFTYLVSAFERDMGSVGYKLCYTRYLKYLAYSCNHYLDNAQGE